MMFHFSQAFETLAGSFTSSSVSEDSIPATPPEGTAKTYLDQHVAPHSQMRGTILAGHSRLMLWSFFSADGLVVSYCRACPATARKQAERTKTARSPKLSFPENAKAHASCPLRERYAPTAPIRFGPPHMHRRTRGPLSRTRDGHELSSCLDRSDHLDNAIHSATTEEALP